MNQVTPIVVRRDPTDASGPTGQLATWLANLQLEDIPEAVRQRAVHLLLDGVGCALVGARLPWSARAVESLSRLEGAGPATLIGWGRSLPPSTATLLNSTFIQGFELDDVHPFAPLHNASLVLPPLLALAQMQEGVTGAAFLKAAVAGFEVGPRAGLALGGIEMLTRGWHSGAVFGTHGAAAASGSLLGLDASGFEDALGLAATQSAGLMSAQFETMCKRMHHGFSARAGLTAAWLAHDGYTGIKRVFEQEYGGFLTMFGEAHTNDASQVSRGLGAVWETERITVKPFACMGALLGPVAAIRRLRAERPFRPYEVEAVDIWVGNAAFHHGAFPIERPLTSVGAQMSLASTAAVAAIDGAAMARQYSAERIGSDDVWTLVPRIRMHVDDRFQGSPKLKLRCRVRIQFTDGTACETEESIRFADEITDAEIEAKFRTLCDGVVTAERRDRIAEAVLGIEHAPELNTLLGLLGPEVTSPL